MEFGFQTPQKNLKFHSASPREISNFSVVFEPNSKFHSPQKDVFTRRWVKMGQSVETSFLWFISHLSCEQICPDSFLWLSICPVLQLQMTLELCPDTSAFCAHQCLVDPAAYCPGPFLPEILPEPSSPCQTSRNVGDRCDQSLTGGVQSMLAVVWLLGLVKFVLDGFSSFFLLTKNGW